MFTNKLCTIVLMRHKQCITTVRAYILDFEVHPIFPSWKSDFRDYSRWISDWELWLPSSNGLHPYNGQYHRSLPDCLLCFTAIARRCLCMILAMTFWLLSLDLSASLPACCWPSLPWCLAFYLLPVQQKSLNCILPLRVVQLSLTWLLTVIKLFPNTCT